MAAKQEPKGSLVTVTVKIPDQKQTDSNGYSNLVEVLTYVMRMGEKMPVFNYWPRGKEIIHRLIMRAAMAENIDEFTIY